MMTPTRRQFMKLAAGMGLGGAAASVLHRLALTSAFAQTQTDYKALVCVFLNGGNDGNNVVVPLSGTIPGATGTPFGAADATGGYQPYYNERSSATDGGELAYSPPGFALANTINNGAAASQLVEVTPGSATGLGPFGMHPSLNLNFAATTALPNPPGGSVTISIPSFRALYAAGKGAVVVDAGTLFRPISKANYNAGIGRPSQLFSHADQISQNQTCIFTPAAPAGVPGGTGWGGRTADKVTLNGTSTFPQQTSISGSAQFMRGANNFPLVIAPSPTALNQVLVLNGFEAGAEGTARRTAMNKLRTVDQGKNKLVDAASKVMQEAVDVSAALAVDPLLHVPNPDAATQAAVPKIQLTFPNTGLGNQLRQVAKVIKANLQQPALALKRQIFFVSIGGFDTHQNQNGTQPGLLQQINQAVATFYYWLANNTPSPSTSEPTLGDLTSKVTTFTISDFGRTFNPAALGQGIVGSDHAWSSHWLVLGGAVAGNRFYGQAVPGGNGSIFHTIGKGSGNAYDVGTRGLYVPGCSTMQYANTLAAWYGMPQDGPTVDYVFPGLRVGNPYGSNYPGFATTNLGFV